VLTEETIMSLLQDKKILITGLLSNRSIAYGIAKAAHREGAQLAFTYQGEDIKARVVDLAKDFGNTL
jgi:enoyl-[acyl-carrier protein] reductase I